MAVVEVHARRLKRLATYDKSKPFSPRGGEGSPMSSEAKGGLEDVVVSTSDICFIDGREGRLVYRGYDVNDLVEHSSFEEVVYLLWHGSLPSRKSEEHTSELQSRPHLVCRLLLEKKKLSNTALISGHRLSRSVAILGPRYARS